MTRLQRTMFAKINDTIATQKAAAANADTPTATGSKRKFDKVSPEKHDDELSDTETVASKSSFASKSSTTTQKRGRGRKVNTQ